MQNGKDQIEFFTQQCFLGSLSFFSIGLSRIIANVLSSLSLALGRCQGLVQPLKRRGIIITWKKLLEEKKSNDTDINNDPGLSINRRERCAVRNILDICHSTRTACRVWAKIATGPFLKCICKSHNIDIDAKNVPLKCLGIKHRLLYTVMFNSINHGLVCN